MLCPCQIITPLVLVGLGLGVGEGLGLGVGLGLGRVICDRMQLLMLANVCNRFLMCAVLSVSLSVSKSITFSKEGRGWKVGHSNSFGGGGARPAICATLSDFPTSY